MFFKRRLALKYWIALVVSTALYGEWLIYIQQPIYWQKLECRQDDANCTKILFIADPQLQGDLAVSPPFNYLFNWDSDRFIEITFFIVLHHFRPDVLVYLGDLMDEGSVATMVQFHSYVKRLMNIFNVHYPIVQVWIPGDNDIGGEFEPIKKEKVAEFAKVFQQPDVVTFRNISVYKVNKITNTMPQIPEELKEYNNLKIVISHYAATDSKVFAQKVIDQIHPDIFFCAHEHESKYVKMNRDLSHRDVYRLKWGDPLLTIPFDVKNYYEIFVPTCSYRMGTDIIGYGAAILENNNKQMQYTVFWSSKRFHILYVYLILLIIYVAYFSVFVIPKFIFKIISANRIIKFSDKAPLMEST